MGALIEVKAALRLCALALIVLGTAYLQARGGAYQAELSHNSDEATHLMNGLLLRDYIRDGLGQNPVQYAEAYYLNYPKIAPGMWPPLFHLALGLLLLLGGPPQATALMLVATATAWAAWRLWRIVERFAGMIVGTVVAALFLLTPLVIDMTGMVMLDVAVATVGLEATYWFAEYAASGRRRHAILFGVSAAACCLIKGNGLAILAVPATFMLLTGRFDLLRQRGLYYAALIVVVVAMPAVLYSYRLDAAIGDFGPVTAAIAWERSLYYAGHLWRQMTPALSILAIIGAIMSLLPVARRSRRDQRTLPTSLTALLVAVLVFHVFNPHTTIQARYITSAIPPLLGLAGLAVSGIVRLGRTSRTMRVLQVATLVLTAVVATYARPLTVSHPPTTWRQAASTLAAADLLAGQRGLVISDEKGEGAFVADVAISTPIPRATVVRGSKQLATDDWNGNGFRLHYNAPDALLQDLEALHIRYVVIDRGGSAARLPYYAMVSELVAREGGRFERLPFQHSGRIELYRVRHQSPGTAKKLTLRISSTGQEIAER